jgi:hypothetical protein
MKRLSDQRTLLSIALTLWLGAIFCATGLSDELSIEDRAKHIILTAPEGWQLDSQSSAERLGFVGPKASGVISSLTVQSWLDGRGLEAVEASLLTESLRITPDQIEESEPLAAEQLDGIDLGHSYLRVERGRRSRIVIALTRNGPNVISLTFVLPESIYDRKQSLILECLASVQTTPLTPAFVDEEMGIRFFDLPDGFEVDAERTEAGQVITWRLEQEGRSLGSLSAQMTRLRGANLSDGVQKRLEKIRSAPDLRTPETRSFYLTGQEGTLIEYVREYEGGSLLNTCWEIYILVGHRLYFLRCSAETENFERRMRPLFDQFMRSIEIDVSPAD